MRNLTIEETFDLEPEWAELEMDDGYAVDVADEALELVAAEQLESDYHHAALDVLSEVLDYQESWARAQEGGWYYGD